MGDVARTQQFGTTQNDYIADAAVDNTGNLYVAYESNLFVTGESAHLALAKFDASGTQVWTKPLAAAVANSAPLMSLATDRDNNLYVLLNPNWPTSNSDAEVRRMDSPGDDVWTRAFPTSWPATPELIATDWSGSIYLGGGSDGPLPGHTEYFGAGDGFLLKTKS